ncbi:sugar ABC transporter ATP-binding protein [Extibacter muris]|uniref:sugar ABC transporter ATP-binding protein n=1 Tax=Extibacter muris TaxID=1796622 RepID=UPI001D086805|nr:sugar ABC transporter ATP-binding protein [Extibacter muris]MCB6202347.1 sugar ABC transporter ATP-binding protein [Extibacter muris]MCQ4665586.1 sugar ABC transporter ATP-binding protein [Extibacter muris]MCQ4695091.1 sugar ABC transporter ATP-binding protein [Extibacter muris]
MENQAILRFHGATKRFGSFVAVDHVDFEVHNKEIVAIIGENGAGKSTFCKMLTGVHSIDEGEMYFEGKKVNYRNTTESMKAGISMVYQERNLVGMLTGAQNICLGSEPGKGLLSEKKAYDRAMEIRNKLHLSIPLDVPVEELGAGEQQLIEIMRAFYNHPKVLILDEPTASLGEGEVEPFLAFVREVREKMDIAVIFISHKIEELFAISDRIVVLTDGKNTLTDSVKNLTQIQVIMAMLRTGKSYGRVSVMEKDFSRLPTVLRVERAVYDGREHLLDFQVHKGEVAGFYGLVGSGRTECAEVLFGLRKADKSYEFNGERITKCNTRDMIERGMIMTPEKRANGMFRSLSLVDNICNLFLKKELAGRGAGVLKQVKSREFAGRVLADNDVKYRAPGQAISSLSGGNIQKIIIGRSIAIENISLLILDEPTNGIDVGAKFEIYRKVRQLTDNEDEEKRIGVVFISSEIDELLNVCDRIYVFADGNIIQGFERKEFDKQDILSVAVRGKKTDE